MNDEIKEILDELKETADYPKINYSSYDKSYNETIDNVAMIKSFACKQLLDYITNLQKEIHKQIHTSIVQKKQINNLQKRNSRQRLANQKQQDLILKLQDENQRLKEDKKKAVEYINNNPFISSIAKVSLLNILQNGSDASVKD